MYRILIILLFISTSATAQIQHWTKDEIIEKQLETGRKAQKIMSAFNYITNEDWKVNDSLDYNEITQFNQNGQKTVYLKYKTDWNKKIKYYQSIDSIFYTEKGIFSEFKRYSPKQDGKYYECTYRAVSVINNKGLIERINYLGGYQMSESTGYELRTYDKNNRLTAVIKYTKDDKEDYKWTFEYNKKNLISKVTSTSAWVGGNSYTITYTAKGLLESYTELYEGEQQSKTSYTYDAQNRLTQRDYNTSSNHQDTMQYFYNGKSPVPYRTYLKYPRGYGTNDFAHEFLAYKFEYFE